MKLFIKAILLGVTVNLVSVVALAGQNANTSCIAGSSKLSHKILEDGEAKLLKLEAEKKKAGAVK